MKRREQSHDFTQIDRGKWDMKAGKEEHIRSLIEHHLISKSLIDFEENEGLEKTETPKFGD